MVVAHDPQKAVEQHQKRKAAMTDIGRGFKALKSELEIGPVYHRLPERIRAHASIGFVVLILHRAVRKRLGAANTGVIPERALQSLKRIQHHRVSINCAPPLCGVSSMTTEQNAVLTALKVKQSSEFK
jgi:transposase